jgi:hypothetical protein
LVGAFHDSDTLPVKVLLVPDKLGAEGGASRDTVMVLLAILAEPQAV